MLLLPGRTLHSSEGKEAHPTYRCMDLLAWSHGQVATCPYRCNPFIIRVIGYLNRWGDTGKRLQGILRSCGAWGRDGVYCSATNRLLRWSKEGRWEGYMPNCGRVNSIYLPAISMERGCPTLMFATKETPPQGNVIKLSPKSMMSLRQPADLWNSFQTFATIMSSASRRIVF